METSLYVGLSGQVAMERRLTTIANNVANAGTAGFRAEGVHFSTVTSRTSPFLTSFANVGDTHVNPSSGGLVKTGNPLDTAIQGQGFMALQTTKAWFTPAMAGCNCCRPATSCLSTATPFSM